MKIFYDVDTQNDFMNKDGALYVPDAELIKPNLEKLTDFAKNNFIPVLGSVDNHFGTEDHKHQELELAKWGGPFPDHCMDGTLGQLKVYSTTLRDAWGMEASACTVNGHDYGVYIPNEIYYGFPETPIPETFKKNWEKNKELREFLEEELKENKKRTIEECWERKRTDIGEYWIQRAQEEVEKVKARKNKPEGIYFEKQSYDVFTSPYTERVLKNLEVDEAVVYGVATDYCVKAAVLGMQKRGIQTYVIEDAIEGVDINSRDVEKALKDMKDVGAKLVTTEEVIRGKL